MKDYMVRYHPDERLHDKRPPWLNTIPYEPILMKLYLLKVTLVNYHPM